MPCPPRVFETFAASLLSILEYLHMQVGLLHADIKPANLLVMQLEMPDGRVLETLVLSDLGSAVPLGVAGQAESPRVSTTLNYASGDVLRSGFRWSVQAELHSVAVTLFELLTGRLPPRNADRSVPPGACAAGLASQEADVRAWGSLLDQAIAGRFTSVKEFYQANRAATSKRFAATKRPPRVVPPVEHLAGS